MGGARGHPLQWVQSGLDACSEDLLDDAVPVTDRPPSRDKQGSDTSAVAAGIGAAVLIVVC